MLYRVLCLALAAGAPAAASVAMLPQPDVYAAGASTGEMSPDEFYTAMFVVPQTGPDPFDTSDGHRMWDAMGEGCVDGGTWEDEFPASKGDIRSPAFCVPQPCARMLTQDELAREVLGRPLQDGDWVDYLRRYSETCDVEVDLPDESASAIDLIEYDDWASLVAADGASVLTGTTRPRSPAGAAAGGSSPRAPATATAGGGNSGSKSPAAQPPLQAAPFGPPGTPSSPVLTGTPGNPLDPWGTPQDPWGTPSGPQDPWGTPGGPGAPSVETGTPLPAPVPLPATLPLLAGALGALSLGRRLRTR